MADTSRFEIAPKDLRWRCAPDKLGFDTTDDFTCKPHIIGQDRALDAIELGLELRSPGYNIYISGLTGTGKSTAIKRVLKSMDLRRDDLTDICYVHNFKRPDSPRCIVLAAGMGGKFKQRMQDVLSTIREFIPAAFKSEAFKERQARILEDVKKLKNEVAEQFEKEVTENGFSVVEVEYGNFSRPEIAPVVAGQVVTMDNLPGLLVQGKVGKGDYEKMQAAYPVLMERLEEVVSQSRELQSALDHRMHELQRDHLEPMVSYTLGEVKQDFDIDSVDKFLEELQSYIMDHLAAFFEDETAPTPDRGPLLPFEVNVIVDNAGAKEAPVILETSPTFMNLFGAIDRIPDGRGDAASDFTTVRAGSLHRANGGYLVLALNDLLEEPHVYLTLKRALKNNKHQIRGFDSLLLAPVTALKPEPIALDLKVILIGDAYTYQVLYEYDEDFPKIFKVKAEFDSTMPNRRANVKRYSQFVKNMCIAEDLLPFHNTAVAAMVEEGVRLAGRQNKLSTQFSDIGDIVREASHWARKARARAVRATHVEKAVDERIRRVRLTEEKMQEMYDDGTILLDTSGTRVGQVNGLAVFDTGDHSFGKPSRITVETGVGRTGLINIEREAEMSGRVHNKGMLILEGYIRRLYAQDKPITMAASICFEQAYSSIDGDSASSTEIYALLSSLSGVGLRQDVAVTGSVNQKGEVQPIGGANEKIEGFFDVCAYKGLTGTQGVMIPALNKKDLMLRADVVEAVRKRKFHIHAIRTIDEGIEVLTGRKAGRRLVSGRFPRNTIHSLVDEKLRRFHDMLRDAEDGLNEESRHKKD